MTAEIEIDLNSVESQSLEEGKHQPKKYSVNDRNRAPAKANYSNNPVITIPLIILSFLTYPFRIVFSWIFG